MKSEVKTPVVVGVLVIVVGGLIAFAIKYANGAGNLDHGQISYTPGVPPWEEKDPTKRAQFNNMPGELRTFGQNQAGHAPPGLSPAGK